MISMSVSVWYSYYHSHLGAHEVHYNMQGSDKETSFIKFRRWWKGVNIFEKAYILLPIHQE